MKKLLSILVVSLMVCSCKDEKKFAPESSANSGEATVSVLDTIAYDAKIDASMPDSLKFSYTDEKSAKIQNFQNYVSQISLVDDDMFQPVEKNLQNELIDIFNPDNFSCGCKPAVVDKLKKGRLRNMNGSQGFIPDEIQTTITAKKCQRIDAGVNVLLHSFTVTQTDGKLSKLLYPDTSPTAKAFSLDDFLINNDVAYPYFMYTLDCSGLLSLALSAGVDVKYAEVKASAQSALSNKKSIAVLYGVARSPLREAYDGTGIFEGENDKDVIKKQIAVLASVLKKLPIDYQPKVKSINLNENYLILCASNTGESSFNGEVEGAAKAGSNFIIGNVNGSVDGRALVKRGSSYKSYRTYSISNVNSLSTSVSLNDFKNKIQELSDKLTALP